MHFYFYFYFYKLALGFGPVWFITSQPETRLDSSGGQVNLPEPVSMYSRERDELDARKRGVRKES